MARLRSSLARYAASMRDPASPEAMAAMRQRAWMEYGIACLPIAELTDEWELATVTAIATRMYGKRISR